MQRPNHLIQPPGPAPERPNSPRRLHQALFVHGLWRTPLSGWTMLRYLRARGLSTHSFGYMASFESFEAIRDRLARRIAKIAAAGDYILIGHSLGGVLLRAALTRLPEQTRPPLRLFLLGSPVRPARLAQRLGASRVFRLLAGDCGHHLGSEARMTALGAATVPTTVIAGVRGFRGRLSPFGDEPNDGIVALAETAAPWADEQLQVPVVHTFLPSSLSVAKLIAERVED